MMEAWPRILTDNWANTNYGIVWNLASTWEALSVAIVSAHERAWKNAG